MAQLTVSATGVQPPARHPRRRTVLSRRNRLSSSQLFARTVRRGARAGSGTVVLHLLVTAGGAAQPDVPPRVGVVVSRAVGPAVTRNLVKRRLRHVARARLGRLPASAVLVVRALPAAAGATFGRLEEDFEGALLRVLAKRGLSSGART